MIAIFSHSDITFMHWELSAKLVGQHKIFVAPFSRNISEVLTQIPQPLRSLQDPQTIKDTTCWKTRRLLRVCSIYTLAIGYSVDLFFSLIIQFYLAVNSYPISLSLFMCPFTNILQSRCWVKNLITTTGSTHRFFLQCDADILRHPSFPSQHPVRARLWENSLYGFQGQIMEDSLEEAQLLQGCTPRWSHRDGNRQEAPCVQASSYVNFSIDISQTYEWATLWVITAKPKQSYYVLSRLEVFK